MNNLDIEYNTERPHIQFPEYGRSLQEMIQHAKSIESRPLRQKTVEYIISLMFQLGPQGHRNMDDYREKLWNHIFAVSNYELDVTPPPGIAIRREEDRARPEPLGYPNSATRMRHYGNSIPALIKKAIEMPDGVKKEGFVEVIASYMKLAYKTWNKEHYVSDDVVKDKLAAGAGKHDKDRNRNRNRQNNGGGGGRRNRQRSGGSGGNGGQKRRKR
jgi:hypothetical protein